MFPLEEEESDTKGPGNKKGVVGGGSIKRTEKAALITLHRRQPH